MFRTTVENKKIKFKPQFSLEATVALTILVVQPSYNYIQKNSGILFC